MEEVYDELGISKEVLYRMTAENLGISKHPGLSIFKQHGFVYDSVSGQTQAVGRCPFCGHMKHFFINPERKAWDCKTCGKAGGFKTFLVEVANHFQQYFVGKPAEELSENRGISIETLKRHNVGYNPFTKAYTLPIPSIDEKEMWDVKVYKDKRLNIGAGCFAALFNWEKLQDNNKVQDIWICEGEWDGMALEEIFIALGRKDKVCAVPGANTFKQDWAFMFKGKNVRVLYDNDKAGVDGSHKVFKALGSISKKLSFINWPDTFDDGFDVRDYYKKNNRDARRTFALLSKFLKDTPKGATAELLETIEAKKGPEYNGEGMPAEEVYAVFNKWLKLKDTNVIDVLAGTIIANRWDGEPIWLFLVAPSGGVKTELIMSLDDMPDIVSTDDVTPQALVSGSNSSVGGDPSLIPKFHQKIWTIKDFTVALSRNEQEREQIFAILRAAYDQKLQRTFGNGVIRVYNSKFGVVAGVTPIIEMFSDKHTALGERFIRYHVPTPTMFADQKYIVKQAIKNSRSPTGMRDEIKATMAKAMNYNFGEAPHVPEAIEDKVIALAKWTSMLRATVFRELYSKEMTHSPMAELPTRLGIQLYKHLQGVTAFRRKKEATEAEFSITKQIAIATAPHRLERIIRGMYLLGKQKQFTISEICKFSGLPQVTTLRLAENMQALGIFDVRTEGRMKSYGFSKEILNIMQITGLYALCDKCSYAGVCVNLKPKPKGCLYAHN